MEHVAIMNKKKGLISKILSGEKSIESRWYVNRIAPWNKIASGDTVYFKESGGLVTATAIVKKVLQFELENLSLKNDKVSTVAELVKKYSQQISFSSSDEEVVDWIKRKKKRYALLIFLEQPKLVSKPFAVNKQGFGNSCAWMCVENIKKVKAK